MLFSAAPHQSDGRPDVPEQTSGEHNGSTCMLQRCADYGNKNKNLGTRRFRRRLCRALKEEGRSDVLTF